MKVLLVNPPVENIIDTEMPLLVRQNEGVFPPLGLMYIASYLKENVNCEIRILDTLAERMGYGAIEEYIKSFSPDVIGITAHTNNLVDVVLVADTVKKIDSNIYICLGGPHTKVFPRESISIKSIDFVVVGEGELSFAELVNCIQEKGDFKKVKGIIFKKNGEIIQTEDRENISDIDRLYFPDRSLIDNKKYFSILGTKAKMTTMISSRGCPYRCLFCSTPRDFRMHSAGSVISEIEECVKFGIKEIHFVDDIFNVDINRVTEICDEIIKKRLKIKWSFRGRVDKFNEDLIKKLKRAGCYRIHLGVETSTNEGLDRLNKGITVEEIRQVFKWTRSIGINTVAYFLIGCPHEKIKEDMLKTINFSKEINPDFALFNILTPYPATRLYEEGLRKGMFKKDSWKEFALNPKKDFLPPFWEEWLSRDEIISLLSFAYRKFYIRPRFILRTICALQNLNIFARRLKTGLEIFKLPLKR